MSSTCVTVSGVSVTTSLTMALNVVFNSEQSSLVPLGYTLTEESSA
jgi:hypothetical protein